MPSMPDCTTFNIHEDDDGTYAVLWASTERVAEWYGTPQRGLTLDQADDAADHLEVLERMAAVRSTGRLDS